MEEKQNTGESGVLVLEATFGFFITIVVMLFLLSIGLLLYQRVLVTVTANEAAANIAQTYKFQKISDNSNITKESVTNVVIFRGMFKWLYDDKNTSKAYAYVNSRLKKTSLASPQDTLDVTVHTVHDDIGRNHYEIRVSQKYVFLFGDILNLFGLHGYDEISAVSRVEAQDMMGYISTVKLYKYIMGKTEKSTFVKMINSAFGIIENVIDIGKNTTDDEYAKYREDQAKKKKEKTKKQDK